MSISLNEVTLEGALNLHREGRISDAKSIYNKLLTTNPNNAKALHFLGVASHQSKQYEEALQLIQRAISIEPNNPSFYSNLGNTYKSLELYDEAIVNFKKALEIDYNFTHAHSHLAWLMQSLGRMPEAQENLEYLLRNNPDDAEVNYLMGNFYKSQGDFENATIYYLQSITLQPEYFNAYNNLALTMEDLGLRIDAIETYRQGLVFCPESIELNYNLGNNLCSFGKFDEAMKCYQEALNLSPGNTQFIAAQASILYKQRKINEAKKVIEPYLQLLGQDGWITNTYVSLYSESILKKTQIKLLKKCLERQDLVVGIRRNILFSLGKICDKHEQYEDAFNYYKKGNQLKQIAFNPEIHGRRISELIAIFTEERLSLFPRSQSQSQLPIFIIGMPRSGTSLVEQILASHPEVYGAGELEDISLLVKMLPNFLQGIPYPRCLERLTLDLANQLSKEYLDQLQSHSSNAHRITDKMPGNFNHLGLLSLLFPKAKLIHCTRNPLDTCLSCYFHDFGGYHPYSYSLSHLGQTYHHYQKLMKHWKNVLDIEIFDVCYEDMVSDFERVSRSIVEFCELEWNDACLLYYESSRIVNTASIDQVRKPIYSSSVNRYKHYEPFLDPLKIALGYDG
jgi:tetratricopeptide (TPR) repeat protein